VQARHRSPDLPLIAVLVLMVVMACAPTDERGTLVRARGGTIRVGVSENRPWTTLPSGGGAGGLEGALAAEVARDLGAKIEWVRAPESQLLEALALHELDLVIGGLTHVTPWKSRVALTRPFYVDTIVVAGPEGAPTISRLHGHRVAVRAAEAATGAFVRAAGGVPHLIPEVGAAPGLVAAPSWQLPALGMTSVGIRLRELGHVIATPRGENAWRAFVEASLAKRVRAVGEILRTQRP
jgi:polar amino acid transport system substrate-binding protein